MISGTLLGVLSAHTVEINRPTGERGALEPWLSFDLRVQTFSGDKTTVLALVRSSRVERLREYLGRGQRVFVTGQIGPFLVTKKGKDLPTWAVEVDRLQLVGGLGTPGDEKT